MINEDPEKNFCEELLEFFGIFFKGLVEGLSRIFWNVFLEELWEQKYGVFPGE